jgi:hypothetical protein
MKIMLFGGMPSCAEAQDERNLMEMRGYDAICFHPVLHPSGLVKFIRPLVLRHGTTDLQVRKAVYACRLTGNALLHIDDLPAVAPASMEVLDALNVIDRYDHCVPLSIDLPGGQVAQVFATRETVQQLSGRVDLCGAGGGKAWWQNILSACARAEQRINAFFGDGLKNPMSLQMRTEALRGHARYNADQPPTVTG